MTEGGECRCPSGDRAECNVLGLPGTDTTVSVDPTPYRHKEKQW